jgi:hypothetical protein
MVKIVPGHDNSAGPVGEYMAAGCRDCGIQFFVHLGLVLKAEVGDNVHLFCILPE